MQKRFGTFFLVLSAVLLAGCGSREREPATMAIPTSAAAVEENLENQGNPSAAVVPENFKDPVYNGLIKELIVPCEYDLDGDGTAETINYQVTDPERGEFDLKIGDAEIEGSGDQLTGSIYAMSIDGETLQILLEDRGNNADEYSHVYVYQQGVLEPAGVLEGEVSSYRVDTEKQQVTAAGTSRVFQSFTLEMDFALEDGVITEVPREFYQMGNEVTLRRALSLIEIREGTAYTLRLEAGSRLVVLGTDNRQWVCLQDVETGEEGWLQVPVDEFGQILVDGVSVSAQDYFDGLYYFG